MYICMDVCMGMCTWKWIYIHKLAPASGGDVDLCVSSGAGGCLYWRPPAPLVAAGRHLEGSRVSVCWCTDVTIICIMCGCLFDCFFFCLFFILGQLYLGNGSSHCSTYAIRWLCLVNCVMWRVCAAGCAREWVVLIIVVHRELIT